MAITAAGVGSGLDIENIVSQLMQLERQPIVALQRKEAATNTELSAYGQLKSAISSFQDAMSELSSEDKFKIFSPSSSDEDVMTASADSDAAAGIYSMVVERLAQNHKMGSDQFAATDTFGGDTGDLLTLTVGSDSMSVDLSTAMTLAEIRDQINSDTDNPGVTATILNVSDTEQRLILTADESGYDSRVQVAYTDSDSDVDNLNFTTSNQVDGSTLVEGELGNDLDLLDAAFTIDGYDLTASSNNVSGVLDGLTLELVNAGSATINVARDTEAIQENAQALVDAYNSVMSTLDSLSSSQLSGESAVRSIASQMRDVLNTQPTELTGSFDALSQVGISSNAATGLLSIDSDRFSDALDTDFASVAELFGNDDQGYAFRFEALADQLLETDGIIDLRQDGLRDRISRYQNDQSDLERRLVLKERQLRNQYSALDGLLGRLQSTSSFLFQQISNL